MALTDGAESEFVKAKMSRTSDEIIALKQQIKNAEKKSSLQQVSKKKVKNIWNLLAAEDFEITEYDDALVARVIEQVIVEENMIFVRFIGGQEIPQML